MVKPKDPGVAVPGTDIITGGPACQPADRVDVYPPPFETKKTARRTIDALSEAVWPADDEDEAS